jgi:hypothetical protein
MYQDKIENNKIVIFFGNIKKIFSAKISWIFLFLVILLTSVCCYIWYFYLYNANWSEERKQSYIQTKEKGIALDREKFDNFIQESENRQIEFQKDLLITSDIFKLKN